MMSSPLFNTSFSLRLLALVVGVLILQCRLSYGQPWEGKVADIRAHNISKITKVVDHEGKRDTVFVLENQLLPEGRIRQVKRTHSDSLVRVFDSLNRLIEVDGKKLVAEVVKYDGAGNVAYDSTADSVYERTSDHTERWKSTPGGKLASQGILYLDHRYRDSLEVVHIFDTTHTDSLLKIIQTWTTHSPDFHNSHRVITTTAPNGALLATETWDVDSTLRRATRTVQYGRRTLQGTIVWSLDKTAEQGEWLNTAWDRHFSDDKSRYIWDLSSGRTHTHTEWIYEYNLGAGDSAGNR